MVPPHDSTIRPLRLTRRGNAAGGLAGPGRFWRRRGFSLAELLMVMAIMGVAGAIAMPRFAEAEMRWRARGAAERIVADLERARTTALATSASLRISFSRDGYQMKSTSDLPAATALGTVMLSEKPYLAQITSVDFGGTQILEINGAGIASSDGTIVVGAGEYRVAVKFTKAGGTVTIGEVETGGRLVIVKGEDVESEAEIEAGGGRVLGGR